MRARHFIVSTIGVGAFCLLQSSQSHGAPTSQDGSRCTIVGTAGNDVLIGTIGNDVICGLGGNDTISGGYGNDTIDGGAGNDTIDGGAGNDKLFGGNHNDKITGKNGNDTIDGGAGNDTLNGGDDRDALVGAAGADTLLGGNGSDTLNGGSGNDSFTGGLGADTISFAMTSSDVTVDLSTGAASGDGTDTLTGIENATGGSGNDKLTGNGNDNVLEGGDGKDSLFGNSGEDSLAGGEGDDLVSGGDGTDLLDGGTGLNYCDYSTGERRTTSCVYDDDRPTLDVSFDQTALNVGTSDATIDVHFTTTDATEINTVSFYCSDPTATSNFSVSVYNELNISSSKPYAVVSSSGDAKSFTAHVQVVLPFGSRPGRYECSAHTSDTLGNRGSGWFSLPATFTVTREGGQFDDDRPTLDVSFDQTTLDVSTSDATIDVHFTTTDATEINTVSFYCSDPTATSNFSVSVYNELNISSSKPYAVVSSSGDAKSFTAHVQVVLPFGSRPGRYECSAHTSDTLGNRGSGWFSLPATFTVTR